MESLLNLENNNIPHYIYFKHLNFHLPELAVNASVNCSLQEDVPIMIEALALCTNLSTVFCKQTNIVENLKKIVTSI